jgi:DNA-binding NtrC family response regulator
MTLSDPPTVLLVDDSALMRKLVGEQLRDLNFHVLEAREGEEALRLVAEYEGEIRILVTDLQMPKMTGGTLAARLRESHPEVQVIFMSGSGSGAMADPAVRTLGGRILEKPFTLDAFEKALTEALGRP